VGTWLSTYLIISFFRLLSNVFSIILCTRLGLSYFLVLGVSHCICNSPLDPMCIHFFRCTHSEEKMALHDVLRDAFTIIARDAKFHVLQK